MLASLLRHPLISRISLHVHAPPLVSPGERSTVQRPKPSSEPGMRQALLAKAENSLQQHICPFGRLSPARLQASRIIHPSPEGQKGSVGGRGRIRLFLNKYSPPGGGGGGGGGGGAPGRDTEEYVYL